MLTKKQLLNHFRQSDIAKFLGITRGAIHQWNMDDPIDLGYEYRFRHSLHYKIWARYNLKEAEAELEKIKTLKNKEKKKGRQKRKKALKPTK